MGEKPRIVVFTEIGFEDGDWDGPHPQGELLRYRAKNDTASIRVTRDNQVLFDADYRTGAIITLDGNVVHLPEGVGPEI